MQLEVHHTDSVVQDLRAEATMLAISFTDFPIALSWRRRVPANPLS